MTGIPASVAAPARFCSPGLNRLLVRLGVVSAEALADFSHRMHNQKAIAALVAEKSLSESELAQRIAEELRIPFAELSELQVGEIRQDLEIAAMLEDDFFLRNRCLPLGKDNGLLRIAMADPLDQEAISELEFLFQIRVSVAIASEEKIVRAISRFFNFDEVSPSFSSPDNEAPQTISREDVDVDLIQVENGDSLQQASQAVPIVKLVNKILGDALWYSASDIHLEPTAVSLEVRYRVDGMMRSVLSIPKRLQPYVTTRLKVLSGMDITIRHRPQDGRFRMRSEGDSHTDLRVSSVPTPFGEKLVLRLLRSDTAGFALNQLGMPEQLLADFRQILAGTEKIVLAVGPTGSGKTTTLYAALSHVKNSTTNIVTVEDPIEFRIPGITQIQVDTKVGMTFAGGLRSILRQDPDIIFVGEIRDLETAEVAAQAAQTGHLVLSTLHATSASGAVIRLVDLGLEPYAVASSLGAVIAQRLVRRVCPKCSSELTPKEKAETWQACCLKSEKARIGRGCDYCGETGYRGRIGIYSLLVMTNEIREAIRRGASEEEILSLGRNKGLRDLAEAGMNLVEEGVTTLAELERVVGRVSLAQGSARENGKRSIAASTIPTTQAAGKQTSRERKASVADLAQTFSKEISDPAQTKILLVDDDDGIRAVMSHALRRAGFIVQTAEDGSKALDILKKQRPDIIVCDLIMPDVDGKAVVKSVKGNAETAGIPILMLTGSDNETNEIALLKAGADDFVSKTATPALVITRIQRLLR